MEPSSAIPETARPVRLDHEEGRACESMQMRDYAGPISDKVRDLGLHYSKAWGVRPNHINPTVSVASSGEEVAEPKKGSKASEQQMAHHNLLQGEIRQTWQQWLNL
ncbi:hypothetical protein PG993_010894 [Apiospora rasikravindrae]|uniref:Uncharacterized protein n=1 Tax=Apiospora rasikravindrae TaxID=990691 RepID=A0ABR1SCQ1_9PEZI